MKTSVRLFSALLLYICCNYGEAFTVGHSNTKSPKLAIVTGANKGIGFAIVRGLCKRFDGDVYLTSRDVERGKKAVHTLEAEGLNPKYHQLDITDQHSLEVFRDYIKDNYDGIDVLVNNAGIFNDEDVNGTIAVNYYALNAASDTLFPLLKKGARVINLSSAAGHLSYIPDASLRNKLKDPKLTVPELSGLLEEYLDAVQKGTQGPKWGYSPYFVSKAAVTALSKIQQRELDDRDIKVNSVHPGYVNTDLTNHQGILTTDQGAEAPLYLALDAPDSIKGQYVWNNKEVANWEDPTGLQLPSIEQALALSKRQ